MSWSPRSSCVRQSWPESARLVGHAVDHHRDRQDQRRVMLLCDLYAVGVRDAEPLLGHLGYLLAVLADPVLVVDDVSLDVQVVPMLDVDVEPFPQRGDQSLLHRRHAVTVAVLDLHAVAHPQHALLDLEQLMAGRILQNQGVPHSQRLAVDLERAPALLVFDPVVVTDGDQLLPHSVGHGADPAPFVASFLASFLTSVTKTHGFLRWLVTSTSIAWERTRFRQDKAHPPRVRQHARKASAVACMRGDNLRTAEA